MASKRDVAVAPAATLPLAAASARQQKRSGGNGGGVGDFMSDTTTAYAAAVIAGDVVAGRPVRLACERHVRDLQTGHLRGLRFDPRAAEFAIQFIGFMRLAEGEHAGKPFILQPFQRFIVGSLFGWMGADDYRRFRTAYIEMGKGSGKTPLAAGIAVKGLIADGEAGAEIYAAAVGRDQAKIAFSDAEKMIMGSDALASRITRTVNNLAVQRTNSFFRPVSSEGRGLDGKRVHMAIIDELHEHPNAIVVDKMSAGTKGRRQPLIVEITNSGYDRNSVCWHHHEYSLRVLEGAVVDDSWFGYVCSLDACEPCRAAGKSQPQDGCSACDDWTDEAVWVKANPNLDISITRKYLRQQVTEAIGMPSKQNIVKRLNFCVWTEQANRWIDLDLWNSCGANGPIDETLLAGRDVFLGLDLSSTEDIAALAKLFPRTDADPEHPRYRATWRFWVPRNTLNRRSVRERQILETAAAAGYVTITEGGIVDYDVVRAEINAVGDQFAIQEIAYDPWNATQIVTQLQGDGFTMVPIRQGFPSLTAPTKELGNLIKSTDIDHGGNPVATWMASNVSIAQDAAGNIKPDKSTSADRIDGISALINCLARAIVQPKLGASIYEEQEVEFL